jgi:hypothetical protein
VKIVRTREEWAPLRERGRRWFLVRYGVIGRGLPLALICALAIEVSLGSPFPEALRSQAFLGRLALAFAVFSLSGCITANATWNLYERRLGPASEGTRSASGGASSTKRT